MGRPPATPWWMGPIQRSLGLRPASTFPVFLVYAPALYTLLWLVQITEEGGHGEGVEWARG